MTTIPSPTAGLQPEDEQRPAAPHSTQHRLTETDEQAIVTLIKTGKSFRQVAKELEFSANIVSVVAKRYGVKSAHPAVGAAVAGHRRTTKASGAKPWKSAIQPAEVMRLVRQGLSKGEIARRFGVSYAPITRIIKQAGMVVSDKRGRPRNSGAKKSSGGGGYQHR